jgi:type VI secretion system secreted protein Hcp
MFLKLDGATGEATDNAHKDEIEVVSWSWALKAPGSLSGGAPGQLGATSMSELQIIKRADRASTALMNFLRANKLIGQALLTVRKAGDGARPLEYLTISLQKVRVASIAVETHTPIGGPPEVMEKVALGFAKVVVTYRPQSNTGSGAGDHVFEADAHTGK